MRKKIKTHISRLQKGMQIPGRHELAQIGAGIDLIFFQDGLDVRFDGIGGDVQGGGDLAVGIALADVRHDLLLAGGQVFPIAQGPGLKILFTDGKLEQASSNLLGRALLTVGD